MKKQNWTTLVQAILDAAGISQAELARRLAVLPSAVVRWRHGEKEPRIGSIERVADAADVELGYRPGAGWWVRKRTA